MGMSDTPQPERLTQALRAGLRDGVQLLRVRLALLGVEAREHALGVVELLAAALAAVILLGLGLGFLAVLLTVMLWDSYRVLALTVFATFFLTLGIAALAVAKANWRRQSRWFDASVQELRQDEDRLSP